MVERMIVEPGTPARLADRDPADRLGLSGKAAARARLAELTAELTRLQNHLWAESRRSLLLVLQGLDAAGKDGTIRSVFHGVNPQGCRVASFRAPTEPELAHDYLWRVHAVCPRRGEIGIFNRSHYEDLVTVRVRELVPRRVWRRRPRQVREFERLLAQEGTALVKVFLNISREEQRERLQERVDDPEKRWKFRRGDLEDRALWDAYIEAYDDAITRTSTGWAPWYVVPADRNWVRNVAVATLLVGVLREMAPALPEPEDDLSGIVIR